MLFVFICDIIDSGTYMCVQIGRNSARLYCHQIATDSIENRLEDGNALKLGHGVVEDEAASAADRHSHEDRGPSGVQDLKVDREIFITNAKCLTIIFAVINWPPEASVPNKIKCKLNAK